MGPDVWRVRRLANERAVYRQSIKASAYGMVKQIDQNYVHPTTRESINYSYAAYLNITERDSRCAKQIEGGVLMSQ